MDLSIGSRFRRAWNVFRNRDLKADMSWQLGYGDSRRADRVVLSSNNEKTIVNAIYNRIALDVAALKFRHVRLDENGRFKEEMGTNLNEVLSVEANIDQSGRAFIHDLALSMIDEGVVAAAPVETSEDPEVSNSYDIYQMRVGPIVEWYPQHVKVHLYNGMTGQHQDVTFRKKDVAILENPFYAVMNAPNSTLQRLIRKLRILDVIDEQAGSGKLDLIIQLPYTIRSEARQQQAEVRRKSVEDQLAGNKLGIAYIDSTEKVIQLNRSVENNLLKQVEYLTSMLYSQLGLNQSILDNTADEQTQLSYSNKIVEPIASTITDEFKRKFLTKTARSQGQSIMFFTEPFRMTPAAQMADLADKLTRNEILTSNEVRQIIGMKPSTDPKADELRNSNLNHPDENGNVADNEKPIIETIQKGENADV
nr:MAG TPA: portal protein [Caudoviricetes sp.]